MTVTCEVVKKELAEVEPQLEQALAQLNFLAGRKMQLMWVLEQLEKPAEPVPVPQPEALAPPSEPPSLA